jgi:hypothetical protein
MNEDPARDSRLMRAGLVRTSIEGRRRSRGVGLEGAPRSTRLVERLRRHWHLEELQLFDKQSLLNMQLLPLAHGTHALPPQSRSVSLPSMRWSAH